MINLNELSPLALAFMGDAIHTAYVRKQVLGIEKTKLNNYHNFAKKFCNAKHQMLALKNILPFLNEEEKNIVRRSRNCHSKHSAKNFDEETYKKATAFEALIGYLYLSKQIDRLEEILEFSMKIKEQ